MSQAFALASRLLRQTPIRKLEWVNQLHSELFARLHGGREVMLDGARFEIDPRDRVIRKKLLLYGSYEPYLRSVLAAAALKDTAVLDVGANAGLHTLALARCVGPQGKVLAFEPDPDNFAILQRNVERNHAYNVACYPLALGDRSAAMSLYQSESNRGNLSLYRANVERSGPEREVRVVVASGDDLLRDLALPVSLVKADVEGAEPAVLRGLSGVLQRNPSAVLVFEFSSSFVRAGGDDPLAFLEGLERAGYDLARIDEDARAIVACSAEEVVARSDAGGEALNLRAARSAPVPSPSL